MIFKKIKEPLHTDDFWYDLFHGGYIKPENLLQNKDDVAKIKDAMQLLLQFKEELEEKEIIGES
jgi:hypothetical protein